MPYEFKDRERVLRRLEALSIAMIDALANPPIVLGPGYCIARMMPGEIITWRKLGDKSRPLSELSKPENAIKGAKK